MQILLINYDNGSHVPFFPLGLAYIASALEGIQPPVSSTLGHSVDIWDQAVYHYPDEYLTRVLDRGDYDLVGVGMCAGYYQIRKLAALSRTINSSKRRSKIHYMVGGQIATPCPEYILSAMMCDSVVMGEAEDTVVELAKAIEEHKPLSEVSGIAWKGGINERRPPPDITKIKNPSWHRFNIDVYRLMKLPTSGPNDFCFPILSGRGCPYHCSFCYRMEAGYRARPIPDIIAEMETLIKCFGITHFILADELLFFSANRVEEFCAAVEPLGVKWDCSGRLNAAVCQPEVLKQMKRAGCEYVNYGIEALDDAVLADINKRLNVKEIEDGINATIAEGLTPGLNIMWGNPGDTIFTLDKAVQFLIKYDGCAELRTIRPVTPYPGCPLYEKAIKEKRLTGPLDFYKRHTNSDLATVQWTGLSDADFHAELAGANIALLDNYYEVRKEAAINEANEFYDGNYPGFRGFRAI